MRDGYVDTIEAAEELGMKRSTFWALLKERGIEKYKFPGDRRSYLRRDDLEALKKPVPRASKSRGPVSRKDADT